MDMDVGLRIREARERAGLTLRDLAERVHMDYSALARKERGETKVRPAERDAIARLAVAVEVRRKLS